MAFRRKRKEPWQASGKHHPKCLKSEKFKSKCKRDPGMGNPGLCQQPVVIQPACTISAMLKRELFLFPHPAGSRTMLGRDPGGFQPSPVPFRAAQGIAQRPRALLSWSLPPLQANLPFLLTATPRAQLGWNLWLSKRKYLEIVTNPNQVEIMLKTGTI